MTDEESLPFTLAAAAAVMTVETLGELAYIGWRPHLRIALRVFLMTAVALKLVFVRLALRRNAGGVLALFLYEGSTIIAALSADLSPYVRAGEAAVALGAMTLLGLSMHAFPSPELPRT